MTTPETHSLTQLPQLNRLDQPRLFTHEEALELLPLLMLISTRTKKELNGLNAQIGHFKTHSPKANELQDRINQCMQIWSEKVRRLGAVPLSLCKVKIPSDEGQFYWEYPENKLYLH